MKLISEQRQQIVADKHKVAWKHYYKSLAEYNQSERRYFTEEELRTRNC